jgi:diguanylate cyclase (GGDEF)-like protein
MTRPKIDLRKILIPSDFISIFVIILGLLIAIFLHELAVRLIGISVAILGAVAFFMLISQRISEYVEIKHTPKVQPQNFKVTKKKESTATRTVFEDFNTSFEPETESLHKNTHERKAELNSTDEGFRVVSTPKESTGTKAQTGKIKEKDSYANKEFSDEISGMKIVRKFKGGKEDDFKLTVEQKLKLRDEKSPAVKDTPKVEISKSIIQETKEVPKTIETKKSEESELFDTSEPAIIQPITIVEKTVPRETEAEQILPEPEKITDEVPLAYKEKEFDLQVNLLIEEFEILGNEPRKEFDYFLNRVMMVIRTVTNTRTAAFILVNAEKKELILEAYATDVPNAIIKKPKTPQGNDIVSQIYQHRKPEILTEINPTAELDLIPYYTKSVKTGSFIGVPVFYQNSVIGVLCADTNVVDAYDSLTVTSFGHFTKLISALVQSYIEKYDLMQESKTLYAINQFRKIISEENKTIADIEMALLHTVYSLIESNAAGIIGFEPSHGEWRIKSIESRETGYKKLINTKIDLDKSLLGRAVSEGKTIAVSPFEGAKQRFALNEPKLDGGFFAAIPIPLKSFGGVFGGIFVESNNPAGITNVDIDILETLCDHAGSSIEKMHLIELVETGAMIDGNTGMLNPTALYKRLEEEFQRFKEYKTSFVLSLVRIDKYASFDPIKYPVRREKAISHIINLIRKNIRSFDIFGKIDDEILAIGIIGAKLELAKIWAEKLRKEIASSVIEFEDKRFNITISQGLADAQNANSVDDIINHSNIVLKKSADKANSVSVFS